MAKHNIEVEANLLKYIITKTEEPTKLVVLTTTF